MALEDSREGSRPVELYELIVGGETFRITSGASDVVIGASTFEVVSVSRSRVAFDDVGRARKLELTLPSSHPAAMMHASIPPGERSFVNAFRYQRDESPPFATAVLLFQGVVQTVRFPQDQRGAVFDILPDDQLLRADAPRASFSATCDNFLYDKFCGADPSANNHIGEVTAVSGLTITVDGAAASGHDFVSGHATPTAELDYRTVYEQSGDVLTLNVPFASNVLGSDVQVFAGCDHVIDGDCALVFDRVLTFRGFAWVPQGQNPFEKGLPTT